MTPADSDFTLQPMTQAELNEIIRKHHMFRTAKPGGARAVVRDRDLSGLNFTGQDLSQSDFTGCIMYGATLSNASFESATLFGCDLRSANMRGARLVRADLRGADVDGADLHKADLTGADLREGKTIVKRKVKREEDQYSKAAEAGVVQFTASDMTEAVLQGATAINADFTDARMENSDLGSANLKGAVLRGADLTGSSLKDADLRDADFSYATMTGADMKGAEKAGSTFTLTLTAETVGKDIEEFELTLDEMVLKHIEWVATAGRNGVQLVLSNVDMRKAGTLSAQRLTAIKAHNATFAEMDLRGIEMQAAGLDGSDFRKCRLGNSDLRGSRFTGCLMNRADFRLANLNPLTIRPRDGEAEYQLPCRFDSASMRYTNFSGARLMDASFVRADLTGAQFIDCDLRKADFTGAKLTGARFENAILDGSVFDEGKGPVRPAREE